MSKDIVTKESTEITTGAFDETALLAELESGHSDFGAQDMTIPFLRVLQQLSPQVTKGKSEYLAEASAGMFINTASKKLFDGDEGAIIVPCKFQNRYIEWRPRSKGGGLVRDFGDDSNAANKFIVSKGEKGQSITAEGNEIVRSLQYWALVVDPTTGEYEPLVLSLASTQAKKAKDWNYVIGGRKENINGKMMSLSAVPHYFAYKLTTSLESNDMGSWYGIKVEPFGRVRDLPNGQEIYEAAKQFRDLVSQGAVRTMEEREEDGKDDDGQPSPF